MNRQQLIEVLFVYRRCNSVNRRACVSKNREHRRANRRIEQGRVEHGPSLVRNLGGRCRRWVSRHVAEGQFCGGAVRNVSYSVNIPVLDDELQD